MEGTVLRAFPLIGRNGRNGFGGVSSQYSKNLSRVCFSQTEIHPVQNWSLERVETP